MSRRPSMRAVASAARNGCSLLLVLACACTGDIDPPGGTRGGPRVIGPSVGAGAAGTAAGAVNMQVTAADDAMRAADPQTFDVASTYFPGQTAAGGPKRLFRLTRAQLDLTTAALLPGSYMDTVQTTVPRDPLQTNYEYADNLSWNAANFAPYTAWVRALADRVKTAPNAVVDCAAQSNSAACLDLQARRFVTRAFRGVTSEEQLARFSQFFTSSVSAVGLPDATADLVDVTLTSPSYVFREEVLTDPAGTLLPAQFLQAIAYTLADAPPEALGLDGSNAAAAIGTPDALQRTVEQVLASPRAREKLLRFFLAWLEVKEPADYTISTTLFPEFTPEVAAAAVDETKRFLEHQLSAIAPRLKDVTQATQSFVPQALGFIYGKDAAGSQVLVDLDPSQRLGIFTQPAVIASHSGPTTTRLVKRGVFFTRKVMCLPLGNPPPGVDTTLPMTAGATEREKIESITNKSPCNGCHTYINPFGFMQESYDPIGRFRTSADGLPINPAISVDFLDEGPVSTTTSVEALRTFTASARFKQCFARQLFRFYIGRDEVATDDPLLRQMFFAFASGDQQDIVGMLRTLAGAPAFALRSEAP